jgi:hypothetical protein
VLLWGTAYVLTEGNVFAYHNNEGCEMRRLISPLVRDNGPFLLLGITLSDIGNQLCNLLSPLIVTSRNTAPSPAPLTNGDFVDSGGWRWHFVSAWNIRRTFSYTDGMPSESTQSLRDMNLRFYPAEIIVSTTFVVRSLFLSSIFVYVQGYLQKELTLCTREYKAPDTFQTIELLLPSVRACGFHIGRGQSQSD